MQEHKDTRIYVGLGNEIDVRHLEEFRNFFS
jgi:hypothetical protein